MTAAIKIESLRALLGDDNPSFDRFVAKPAQNALSEVIARAPTVGAAVGALLGLWLVARVARVISERLLKLAKLDEAIEETLIARILSGLGDGSTPSKVLSTLVYFAIVLIAFAAAADILGLSAVRAALLSVLAYLPRLGAALAVLGVGGYVARTARRAVASLMKELKSPFAGIAESLTEGVIMLVTVTVCVNQLGADLSFITNNLAMILGAFAATAAFLFAWAMRRPAEEIIANYYLRRLVRIGDQVTIGNVEGTVDRFAALGLLLKDSDGCEHFIPARHVLDGVQRTQSVTLTRPKK
jgi:Conserved TM helix/Mechanosensitive ion channel